VELHVPPFAARILVQLIPSVPADLNGLTLHFCCGVCIRIFHFIFIHSPFGSSLKYSADFINWNEHTTVMLRYMKKSRRQNAVVVHRLAFLADVKSLSSYI
jgi:hypothetical protein